MGRAFGKAPLMSRRQSCDTSPQRGGPCAAVRRQGPRCAEGARTTQRPLRRAASCALPDGAGQSAVPQKRARVRTQQGRQEPSPTSRCMRYLRGPVRYNLCDNPTCIASVHRAAVLVGPRRGGGLHRAAVHSKHCLPVRCLPVGGRSGRGAEYTKLRHHAGICK